jgi:hypothetical protein
MDKGDSHHELISNGHYFPSFLKDYYYYINGWFYKCVDDYLFIKENYDYNTGSDILIDISDYNNKKYCFTIGLQDNKVVSFYTWQASFYIATNNKLYNGYNNIYELRGIMDIHTNNTSNICKIDDKEMISKISLLFSARQHMTPLKMVCDLSYQNERSPQDSYINGISEVHNFFINAQIKTHNAIYPSIILYPKDSRLYPRLIGTYIDNEIEYNLIRNNNKLTFPLPIYKKEIGEPANDYLIAHNTGNYVIVELSGMNIPNDIVFESFKLIADTNKF